METVLQLARDIGARPAGSARDAEAAAYLEARLRELTPNVERRAFSFRGWRPLSAASLELETAGVPACTAVALPYTYPTLDVGFRGTLQWEGMWPLMAGRLVCPRFSLRDAGGKIGALILACPFGEARPMPNPFPLASVPTIVIDASDGDAVRRLLESAPPLMARVTTGGSWEGMLESANVVGDIGAVPPRIVVVAHYDSVEQSPGANDNASGVAVALRLARNAAERAHNGTGIRFLFAGAEEPFLVGSRAYVADTASRDELQSLRGCLNLDMLGVGENFSLRAAPQSLWRRALEQTAGISPAGRTVAADALVPSSDQWSFHEFGIDSAQLTRLPDPAWHHRGDTVERVRETDLDDAESVASQLLAAADAILDRELMIATGIPSGT